MSDLYDEWLRLEESFTEHLENGAEALPAIKSLISAAWDFMSEDERIELSRFTTRY